MLEETGLLFGGRRSGRPARLFAHHRLRATTALRAARRRRPPQSAQHGRRQTFAACRADRHQRRAVPLERRPPTRLSRPAPLQRRPPSQSDDALHARPDGGHLRRREGDQLYRLSRQEPDAYRRHGQRRQSARDIDHAHLVLPVPPADLHRAQKLPAGGQQLLARTALRGQSAHRPRRHLPVQLQVAQRHEKVPVRPLLFPLLLFLLGIQSQ